MTAGIELGPPQPSPEEVFAQAGTAICGALLANNGDMLSVDMRERTATGGEGPLKGLLLCAAGPFAQELKGAITALIERLKDDPAYQERLKAKREQRVQLASAAALPPGARVKG